MKRHKLGNSKRWVIKIGISLLTAEGRGLDTLAINAWVEQIARLRDHGKEIILVPSGAVAEGMARLGWKQRPHAINELQAAAAIGQMGLIQAYESCYKQHKLHTAQILLTHDDLASRERYLNARSTLKTLLKLGAIPIINENDTVATDEIRACGRFSIDSRFTNSSDRRPSLSLVGFVFANSYEPSAISY